MFRRFRKPAPEEGKIVQLESHELVKTITLTTPRSGRKRNGEVKEERPVGRVEIGYDGTKTLTLPKSFGKGEKEYEIRTPADVEYEMGYLGYLLTSELEHSIFGTCGRCPVCVAKSLADEMEKRNRQKECDHV